MRLQCHMGSRMVHRIPFAEIAMSLSQPSALPVSVALIGLALARQRRLLAIASTSGFCFALYLSHSKKTSSWPGVFIA